MVVLCISKYNDKQCSVMFRNVPFLTQADYIYYAGIYHFPLQLIGKCADQIVTHSYSCTHTPSTSLHVNLLKRYYLPCSSLQYRSSSHAEKVTVCICECLSTLTASIFKLKGSTHPYTDFSLRLSFNVYQPLNTF